MVRIVSIATQEVEGVHLSHGGTRIPGDTSPTVGEFFGSVTGGPGRPRGVSVEVGETQAAVDLTVTVPYGRSIPELTQRLRNTAVRRIETLTGLEVTEVNITVRDVFIPQQ